MGAWYNGFVATDPGSARAYLKSALAELGVKMKSASEQVGKNHAYLQQYIVSGKPRWLPEHVRDALVSAYGLDCERLKPALPLPRPRRSVADRDHERQVNTQGLSKFVDDPRKLELLDVYDAIAPRYRPLAMEILRSLAAASVADVA